MNYYNQRSPINQEPQEKSTFNIALKGVAFIICLFVIGYLGGAFTNIQRIDNLQTQNNLTQTTQTTVAAASETTTTTLPESTTEITTTAESTTKTPTTAKPTTTKPTTTKDNVIDTVEEIVTLFNKSSNNVKKNASKVTRLYENRRYDEELSNYPAALNFRANKLINSWLVNHDTPVVYTEKELIIANYPVKGQEWSSKLSAEDVSSATCKEVSGYYEVEIHLDYCVDPKENTGPRAAMEEVTLEKVQELADIVKTCSVEYYDCVIRCSIEKDTGNLVRSKYIQPMILTMTTERFTKLDALFAMTFESGFEIEY